MGRAQTQTQNLTDQQLANINAQNQQFLNQQQQTGNLLNSQFQSILNNPGLSAADKAAVTGQSQGAVASAFDSLPQPMKNYLWGRLEQILTGKDKSATYATLKPEERQALLEILRETKLEFATWLRK